MGPLWELLAKCLDPTDSMDVYAALLARQSILSLALPPTKEPDGALEQVFRADHMLGGETNDVSRSSSGAGESDGEHELESSDVRVITEREKTLLGSVDSPARPEGFEALPGAAEHALLAETTNNFPSLHAVFWQDDHVDQQRQPRKYTRKLRNFAGSGGTRSPGKDD